MSYKNSLIKKLAKILLLTWKGISRMDGEIEDTCHARVDGGRWQRSSRMEGEIEIEVWGSR